MFYLLVFFVLTTRYCDGVEKSRGALGPKVFTFVHGDDDAKLNFTAAQNYCRTIVGSDLENPNAVGQIDNGDGLTHDSSQKTGSKKDPKTMGLSLKTSLASLHSYPETMAIVRWISKEEKNSFWIGGTVTKTLNEFARPIYILHWIDGSNSDFSLFRLPNADLSAIRVGERMCISVDYLTGQWGVHPCTEKRYFLCLTVPVLGSEPAYEPNVISKKAKRKKSWHSRSDDNDSPMLQGPLTPEELKKLLV